MVTTGYLGKKVDIICKDGQLLSGYVFDVLSSEDSDLGCDCLDIAPIDAMYVIEIPIKDIKSISEDHNYKEIDFYS